MYKKILLFAFLSYSVAINAQTPNSWQLFLNNEKISVGMLGKPTTVEISKNKLGNLKLKIFGDTSLNQFRKSVVITDTLGKELSKQNFTTAQIVYHLNEKEFVAKHGLIPFKILCHQVPSNQKNFRFLPKHYFICTIRWR